MILYTKQANRTHIRPFHAKSLTHIYIYIVNVGANLLSVHPQRGHARERPHLLSPRRKPQAAARRTPRSAVFVFRMTRLHVSCKHARRLTGSTIESKPINCSIHNTHTSPQNIRNFSIDRSASGAPNHSSGSRATRK